MTAQDTIPEDIMQAAQKAWDDAMVLTNDAQSEMVIAQAILAERQRCAEISRTIAADLRNWDSTRRGAAKVADAICAAPKGGEA